MNVKINISVTIDNKTIADEEIDYRSLKSEGLDLQARILELTKMEIDLKRRELKLGEIRWDFNDGDRAFFVMEKNI